MPPQRTDKATLNGLLLSGKLSPDQQRAFQNMYDDLMNGKIVNLSKKQRLWADTLWQQHKVGDMVFNRRKEARVLLKENAPLALDTMPKPLKPPGRP